MKLVASSTKKESSILQTTFVYFLPALLNPIAAFVSLRLYANAFDWLRDLPSFHLRFAVFLSLLLTILCLSYWAVLKLKYFVARKKYPTISFAHVAKASAWAHLFFVPGIFLFLHAKLVSMFYFVFLEDYYNEYWIKSTLLFVWLALVAGYFGAIPLYRHLLARSQNATPPFSKLKIALITLVTIAFFWQILGFSLLAPYFVKFPRVEYVIDLIY